MIKWNATKNNTVPMVTGQYLITLEDVRGDDINRYTLTAQFCRWGEKWSWTYNDAFGTTTLQNACESTWVDDTYEDEEDDDAIECVERIVAWAEMPKPYQG